MMDEKKQEILKQEFLDDCVAMAEALRCMRDRGAESIDTDGCTLEEEIFDRCFPGAEWKPVLLEDGEPIGLEIKQAVYRGFGFDCLRETGSSGTMDTSSVACGDSFPSRGSQKEAEG